MTTNESVQFVLRLIEKKHDYAILASDRLFSVLPTDDQNAKKRAATEILEAVTDLHALLPKSDVPSWLSTAISALTQYVDGRWSPFDFLSNFVDIHRSLKNHSWSFDDSAEVPFDFDSIFEHYKKESRLPELFDQIILILEEIQNSGEVDSVMMLRALGKVIATVKRCKDGSYFSLNGAWDFLLSFLNNYLWGELAKLPVLGSALEALGNTIRETNDEMFSVHNKIRDEMARTIGEEVKVLESKSDFSFVTYGKTGRLLPGTSTLQLSGTTA